MKAARPIMISACLLGIECRYDGRHSRSENLAGFLEGIPFAAFCPEQLGGLPTPRPAANIKGGDGRDVLLKRAVVINTEGDDITAHFLKGANEALKLSKLLESRIAITKDKSPSCGLNTPYCDKKEDQGIGVTAALFESAGIRIFQLGKETPFPTGDFLELIKSSTYKMSCF